jgi:hypothetical protein
MLQAQRLVTAAVALIGQGSGRDCRKLASVVVVMALQYCGDHGTVPPVDRKALTETCVIMDRRLKPAMWAFADKLGLSMDAAYSCGLRGGRGSDV